MWSYDQRWYSPDLYRDLRVCVRQPEVGGPWVTENTRYLYDNNFVCHGWRGAGASDGVGVSLLAGLTYWSIACDAQGRKNAFQYERYRWAQDKIRGLLDSIPLDPNAKLTWISEMQGLLTVAVVATNVRTDGDRFHKEGFFGRLDGWLNPGPEANAVDLLQWNYAVTPAGSSMQFLPPPDAALAARFPGRLFPVVPIGLTKDAFCPKPRVADVPQFTYTSPSGHRFRDLTESDREALRRVGFGLPAAEALPRFFEAGAGRLVIPVSLSFGTVNVITIDNQVQRLVARANAMLSKTYFDWIKTALEYYRDRMTAFYGGNLTVSQAESLRLIQDGIRLTAETQATISATGAWSNLSAVLGLVTMVATAVNAAVGAVVAVVSALLVTGLQELSKALGYGVAETLSRFTDPWPPFVRILQDPCTMPTSEADIRTITGTLNPALLRRVSVMGSSADKIRAALASGEDRKKASSSGSGLVFGAAALLLLSRFLR